MSTTAQSAAAGAFALTLLGAASAALAAPPLAYATRAGNFVTSDSLATSVPLNDAQNVQISFRTQKPNQVVEVTYNAECGVVGPVGSWVSIRIFVDSQIAQPDPGLTGFAFCTATSTTTNSWVGAVRQSFVVVPTAGLHTVEVDEQGSTSGLTRWFGDSSIAIR